MPPFPTDEQHQYFSLRPGIPGFSGWGGMHQDGDPGSVPPNKFRRVLNARFGDGIVYGRPGEAELANLGGAPYYLGNFQLGNPRKKLYLSMQGCTGVASPLGTSVLIYDPEVSPVVQTLAQFRGPVDSQVHFGNLGDKLFLGYNSLLREIPLIESSPGTNILALGASQANLPLRNFTGYRVIALLEFPEIGRLFIALQDTTTPTNGKIVSYNGLSFTDEYTGFCPLALGRWRNQIIAGFAGSIRWRDNTSSTWTNVALGGFTCFEGENAIVEYVDKTYIAGGNDIIYSYNGSALAVARTIANCGTTGTGVCALANHRGLLFYLWNLITTNRAKLGRFDFDSLSGTSPYYDVYVDLYAQNANWLLGRGLMSYRSTLFAGLAGARFIGSPMNDVQGTWVQISGAGNSFPILGLFAF